MNFGSCLSENGIVAQCATEVRICGEFRGDFEDARNANEQRPRGEDDVPVVMVGLDQPEG